MLRGMDFFLILLLAAIGAGALWLIATWYFADNEPVLGPASDKRVTFRQVLINAIEDARALFDRLTNTVAVALVSLNAVVLATPEIKSALLASPWGLAALLGLNLFAAVSPRVREA